MSSYAFTDSEHARNKRDAQGEGKSVRRYLEDTVAEYTAAGQPLSRPCGDDFEGE